MSVALRCVIVSILIVADVFLSGQKTSARSTRVALKVDADVALRLVAEAYSDPPHPEWFDYNPHADDDSFFDFQGITEISTFGFFAVNPWTGDVWALWGCHKLSTPALHKDQAAIRRKFTPSELKQYKRLSALRPDCIVED